MRPDVFLVDGIATAGELLFGIATFGSGHDLLPRRQNRMCSVAIPIEIRSGAHIRREPRIDDDAQKFGTSLPKPHSPLPLGTKL
jgi:hypothetical protein